MAKKTPRKLKTATYGLTGPEPGRRNRTGTPARATRSTVAESTGAGKLSLSKAEKKLVSKLLDESLPELRALRKAQAKAKPKAKAKAKAKKKR